MLCVLCLNTSVYAVHTVSILFSAIKPYDKSKCKDWHTLMNNFFTECFHNSGDSGATIVIDNTSSDVTVGFAEDDSPKAAFLSVVGRPKSQKSTFLKRVYVGDEAEDWRSMLSLQYPIERGIVKNWDDLELVSDL